MIRKAHFLREDQVKSLEELPGNESEHIRRAIDEYIDNLKALNVSASQSKKGVKMDNPPIINAEYLTPPPKEQPKPMTMSFFDALKKIQEGKRVTRISWANKDYCLMKDSWLSIFTKDAFHTWIINDGDMESQDFIIITEPN